MFPRKPSQTSPPNLLDLLRETESRIKRAQPKQQFQPGHAYATTLYSEPWLYVQTVSGAELEEANQLPDTEREAYLTELAKRRAANVGYEGPLPSMHVVAHETSLNAGLPVNDGSDNSDTIDGSTTPPHLPSVHTPVNYPSTYVNTDSVVRSSAAAHTDPTHPHPPPAREGEGGVHRDGTVWLGRDSGGTSEQHSDSQSWPGWPTMPTPNEWAEMSVEERGLAVRTGEICYEGAAGTGKTRATLQRFHGWCKAWPGIRILIARDFRDGHTQSTMKTLQNEVFDPEEWGDATSGKPVRWHAGETAYLYDNGSTMVIKGLRDSRGIYSTQYDVVFVNEAGSPHIDEEDYDQLLRSKRNLRFPFSLLVTDLNPEYEMHWLHQRCDDGATTLVLTKHSDNPAASAAYIHDLFSMRDPIQKQRLAKGERVASVKGAYYQDAMAEARDGNRIRPILYQKGLPVHTCWDLGRSDYTAIWLFQRFMGEWHWLDYYESHLEDLDHYWAILQDIQKQHRFVWGTHCLPHDATQKTLASLGQSVQSQLWNLGLVGEVIVPQTPLNVQRNAVRAALATSYFDNSRWVKPEQWHRHRRGVRFGVQRLLTYRAEQDERLGVMRGTPAHDLASHGASAFATGILAAPTTRLGGSRAAVERVTVDYLPRSDTHALNDGYRRTRR